jgi:DNA-binding response OmpR family regulator
MTDQLRCLIVEDQTLIAMSIETYLEDVGIAVQTVTSMAEARAWLEANTADTAIVDFMLKDGPAQSWHGNSTDAPSHTSSILVTLRARAYPLSFKGCHGSKSLRAGTIC